MNVTALQQRIHGNIEASILRRHSSHTAISFSPTQSVQQPPRRYRRPTTVASQKDPDRDLFWPSSSQITQSEEIEEESLLSTSKNNGSSLSAGIDTLSTKTASGAVDKSSSPQSISTDNNNTIIARSHRSPASHTKAPLESADDSDVLIEFKDVHKSFGSKKILRGASFKIRRGEAVGIIGSSGTGKSTTLRLAAGLLQPDSGQVIIKGEPRQGLISDDDTSDKLKVGLVFQSGALFDSLTVKENVGFMLYEHSNLPEDRIEAAVASSLAKVGLSGVENLYPSELSGGMKKRVALARAIVSDIGDATLTMDKDSHYSAEQLIMYDEPTAGLDPVASTVIEDLIRSMHDPYCIRTNECGTDSSGGISSYVVVTHQHSTIRRAVDRIIFLHEGRVVWEGSVDEFDTTDEPIVRQFASGSLQGPIVYL